MGLSDPRRSEQEHVAPLLHEPQARQLAEHLAVDRGLVVELELGQRLSKRVVGEPEPPVQAPSPRRFGFLGEQILQHLDRRQLLVVRPIKGRRELLGRGGQPEVGQMLPEPLVGVSTLAFVAVLTAPPPQVAGTPSYSTTTSNSVPSRSPA